MMGKGVDIQGSRHARIQLVGQATSAVHLIVSSLPFFASYLPRSDTKYFCFLVDHSAMKAFNIPTIVALAALINASFPL